MTSIEKLSATGHMASAIARLDAGVERTQECWLWNGGVIIKSGRTYGRISIGSGGSKRTLYVHRLAYRVWIGPIPNGATVFQTCGNSLCCNPAHLRHG